MKNKTPIEKSDFYKKAVAALRRSRSGIKDFIKYATELAKEYGKQAAVTVLQHGTRLTFDEITIYLAVGEGTMDERLICGHALKFTMLRKFPIKTQQGVLDNGVDLLTESGVTNRRKWIDISPRDARLVFCINKTPHIRSIEEQKVWLAKHAAESEVLWEFKGITVVVAKPLTYNKVIEMATKFAEYLKIEKVDFSNERSLKNNFK